MLAGFPTNVLQSVGQYASAARFLAAEQAAARGSDSIQVAHLLLGLLDQRDPVVMELLNQACVDIPALTHEVEAHAGPVTREHANDGAFEKGWATFQGMTVEQRLSPARFALSLMEIQGRPHPPHPLPNSDEMDAVANLGKEVAARVGSNQIEAEHLLIAIAITPGNVASELKNRGFDSEAAIALLNNPDSPIRRPRPPLWHRLGPLSDVKDRATEYAAANHGTGVTPEDLLSALATAPNITAVRLFERAGVDRQALIDRLGSVKLLDEQALNARWASIKLGDESEALLMLADREAQLRGRLTLGLEDLFLAVLALGKGAAFEALVAQGLNLDACRRLFEDDEAGA